MSIATPARDAVRAAAFRRLDGGSHQGEATLTHSCIGIPDTPRSSLETTPIDGGPSAISQGLERWIASEAKTWRNPRASRLVQWLNPRERAVLVLCVAIALAVLSVVIFPCWTYSTRWGFTPSTLAGVLLLGAAVVVVSSKHASKAAEPTTAMASKHRLSDPVPPVTPVAPPFLAFDGASP